MIKIPFLSAIIIGGLFLSIYSMRPSNNAPLSNPKTYDDFYCAYANEIQSAAIEELEKTYNVQCCAIGGGMPYFINNLKLSFNVPQPGSITVARQLVVNMKEKFLQQINSHEKARPYLISYPFPYENAIISLNFENNKGKQYLGTTINHVIGCNEKISYSLIDYEKKSSSIIYEELYEEAYKIVMGHPRPETLNPGPRKQEPQLNRDGSIAVPAVLNNDPNNPWPEKAS